MASLVLGVAGAAALGPAGLAWGGALGMSGAQIGFTVGSMLGNMMTKLPDVQGPRLGDLKVQSSTYGTSIPIDYGTTRHTGQVMWSTDLIETENEEEAGGKGGPSQSVTSYTYSVSCAVAVCEGEITGIRRIWANGDLIYDQSEGNLGATGQSSNIRIYTGSETQMPSSLQESYLGVGNVPAYRGLSFVEFENLQLEKYGNRTPNFSFEAVANGDITTPAYAKLTESTVKHTIPHPFIDGIYLSTSADNGSSEPLVLHITDVISGTDRIVDISDIPAGFSSGKLCYVDFARDNELLIPLNEIWVANDAIYYTYSNDVAIAFDATTLAFKRRITPSVSQGFQIIGSNMYFDKPSGKVIFAQGSSSVSGGYNALDPMTLIWDGQKFTDTTPDWHTGKGIAGQNSVALSNFQNFICFIVGGQYVHKQETTEVEPILAYDSLRNRYAWHDRNESSKSVFKTVKDNVIFELNEYTPDVLSINPASFDYLPISDQYVISNASTLYFLNPDTFEIESSKTVVFSCFNAMEIANLPEYCVAYVTEPTNGLALVPLTDRLGLNTVTLSSIVTDICGRVDLAPSDIDVTDLTDEVEGYTIGQQMSGRAAIDGLQAAFYFDAVESD